MCSHFPLLLLSWPWPRQDLPLHDHQQNHNKKLASIIISMRATNDRYDMLNHDTRTDETSHKKKKHDTKSKENTCHEDREKYVL